VCTCRRKIIVEESTCWCALDVQALSPVHTSDNVVKSGDSVAETGNIVARNTISPVLATMSPFYVAGFGDIVERNFVLATMSQ